MQDKLTSIDELPEEILVEVAQYLPNSGLINLAKTKMYHCTLFNPMINMRKISYFLQNVVCGNHEIVTSMLQKDIRLIFNKGRVTDCSGRTFDNISGFEYALWALDKHIWTKMIACIPRNEEGGKVFENLITQYTKVNKDGVTYRLNGKTITENHFDFETTIIKELQTQVELVNAPGAINWDDAKSQWIEGVGGAQKLLPIHVVYEYCADENFYLVPEFSSQPKLSKQFYNWITSKEENWFSVDFKLGIEFAIFKASVGCAAAEEPHGSPGVVATRDLDAITELYQVRSKDFINLKSQLEDLVTKDNHHQVVVAIYQ
ncbi:hypothetical protein [Legionella longbeachae]|uniref:F-box domain-containing protein n=1 Tax=Legionella longbeachae serogroup 1 (strain NSW150) TaxID=661367 RepID=D3HIZ9_LEGLN|nr:hypothetical protein [Legionella longbeachae]VEE02887.1 SidC homolog [Legionella oakridgensis]HBD7398909.1 F-box protein [Legionella pneumophila]ARB90870.1 hypothetical protein A6J40_01080 [Legionella longbeachae]ARM32704.1 F-box protein [Legionella longbeachae]EEZ94517.1 conserved hypothetical protein [Legionella longbeachae D-4968]